MTEDGAKRGRGRPSGDRAAYAELRASVVEKSYRELRALGLEHQIANEEIAKAAGWSSPDYVDQVRRQCPHTYRVTAVDRKPDSKAIGRYLDTLTETLRGIAKGQREKRAWAKWKASPGSAAKYKNARKLLTEQ